MENGTIVQNMGYTLDSLVSQIDRLPAPDPTALEVMQLCSTSDVTISRLVEIVSRDQTLTSQVLRIANSSYFNYPKTIHSIDRAIVILGLNLLKDISLSIAFYSFYKKCEPGGALNTQKLWRHSIMTAIIAKGLAIRHDPEHKDLYYVAGLLHDIGKLIEAETISDDFYFLIEKSQAEGLRLDQIEKQFLGFHHGDIGGTLSEQWNLPGTLAKMITYHHCPGEYSGDQRIYRQVCYLYLSNILAHCIQDEKKSLDAVYEYDQNFGEFFSYTPEEFEELLTSVKGIVEQNQQYFEVHQI